ncbi:S-type pyocin domain-containing protein [Streptomyces nitrosporeus]|uniref:S-type pyocin domain-containing protein n=1 Tax=Streptomyces nitrosporeus TaxID=28894 RepID=UPI0039A3B76E
MRAEENRRTDDIIEFAWPREIAESVAARRAFPDADADAATDAPAPTVLNAERGIINTGTVHGGQHVTAIELSGHVGGGTDGHT